MGLSLSVIAGIALLLPGLFAILFWNLRGRRHGSSRPDLPITAVSVLAISIAVSMFMHGLVWLFAYSLLGMAVQIGAQWHSFGPVIRNPIETMLLLAHGGSVAAGVTPTEVAIIVAALFAEIVAVTAILNDEGFDLLLDGVDLSNQGWVYDNVLRPAQNGYRPIAFVLTTLMKDGLGIGYRGTIADIRQSDRGETLAITLGRPARFLFELNQRAAVERGSGAREPSFERSGEEDVGSVVSLDARVIQNIVVSNRRSSQLELLSRLEDERLRSDAAMAPDQVQADGA